MERGMENMSIDDGEEDGWSITGDEETHKSAYDLCLLGWCLIASVEYEDPMQILLVFANFLAQMHNLLPSFFLEMVARQFGKFSKFIEYDMKQRSGGMKNFLRIRVQLDVQNPLKRKKKINSFFVKLNHEGKEMQGWDLSLRV
ncbi:hypothetical protein Gohar_020633, partial [Gossypium harknessii]|nr:hypothetical protein [Gossypium harknessii]